MGADLYMVSRILLTDIAAQQIARRAKQMRDRQTVECHEPAMTDIGKTKKAKLEMRSSASAHALTKA